MKNILLIGSSEVIKKFVNQNFKNNNITYISFRDSWKKIVKSKFDIIIVSGFHFEITTMNLKSLKYYVNNYFYYLKSLSQNCKKIYLISTYLNVKNSFSRVVYFYFLISKKIKNKKLEINILSFNSLLNLNNNKIKILIYKILKKKFHTDYLRNENIKNYLVKKINYINFVFIFIPRLRVIDKIIRIFDK